MKVAKVIARCRRCEGWFHNKCARVTRLQVETELKTRRWTCWMCEEQGEDGGKKEEDEMTAKVDEGWQALENKKLRIMQ